VSCERGAPTTLFLDFFAEFFFPTFWSKIEENLLFIVSFVTYDRVPYNRGLGGILLFCLKFLVGVGSSSQNPVEILSIWLSHYNKETVKYLE